MVLMPRTMSSQVILSSMASPSRCFQLVRLQYQVQDAELNKVLAQQQDTGAWADAIAKANSLVAQMTIEEKVLLKICE